MEENYARTEREMTELSYEARQPWVNRAMSDAGRAQATRLLRAAVLVGLAYYIGARIGFELTLKPSPVSTLWPPNSILLAAFLLSPTRSWWALLGGCLRRPPDGAAPGRYPDSHGAGLVRQQCQ